MSKAVVSQSFPVAGHTVQFEYFDIFGSGAKISEGEFAAKYPEIYAAQTNFQFELVTKELTRQEIVGPPAYSFDHIGNILLDKVN